MIVVADTSPLNYLVRLGHISILRDVYGRIAVPPSVLSEMWHPGAADEVRQWATGSAAWLEESAWQ